MSDLSRLLGGVYQPGAEPADDVVDDAPDAGASTIWHADEQLDAAFEHWVPGPSGDASDRERDLFAEAQTGPTATTSSEAAVTTPTAEAAQPITTGGLPTEAWPVEAPSAPEATLADERHASVEPPSWRPEDDDILPTRAVRRFFSLRR